MGITYRVAGGGKRGAAVSSAGMGMGEGKVPK